MYKSGSVTSAEIAENLGVKLIDDEVNTTVSAFKEVKALLGDKGPERVCHCGTESTEGCKLLHRSRRCVMTNSLPPSQRWE